MIGALVVNWLVGHWVVIAAVALLALLATNPALLHSRVFLAVALLVLAFGFDSWHAAVRYADGVRDTQAAAAKAVAAADLRASESAREAEAARAGVFHSIEVAYAKGEADARAAVSGVLDDVAAGRYVLRAALRCPAVRPAGAPAPEAGGTGDAAATAGVLPAPTVLDLVRAAGDADGVLERDRLAEQTLDAIYAAEPQPVTP